MKLPFGEWLPDFGYLRNPGVTEAKNVIPAPDGYRPLGSLSVISEPVDSICLGGISVVGNDGVIYNYAGTKNSLYQLGQGTWTGLLNHYYTSQVSSIKLTGATANVVFS